MYFHLLCNFATSLIFTFPAGPAMRTRLAVPRHVATAIISLLCQRIAFVECFSTSLPRVRYESVALGAGCFWHVEFALRRLPGVLATETAYAGGSTLSPSYRDVCEGRTGHAEVVKIAFDADILHYDVLFDCFLSMHDPTKVRSHGKHAEGTGQYRSSIFCENPEIYQAALSSLGRCRDQLGKDLSTDLRLIQKPTPGSPFGEGWCWKAEERHQRHDEKLKKTDGEELTTLSAREWLKQYGRRRPTVVGSAETVPVGMDGHPDDDGMARLMI